MPNSTLIAAYDHVHCVATLCAVKQASKQTLRRATTECAPALFSLSLSPPVSSINIYTSDVVPREITTEKENDQGAALPLCTTVVIAR